MRRGDWRDAIGHDGWFVVRLRVFTVDEGGQHRYLQSGFKAVWTSAHVPHPLYGPVVLPPPAPRSVAPGAEAIVHVRPMQPGHWVAVEPGMRLGMCKNWPRELGEGIVLERMEVPRRDVPVRVLHPPSGTPAVAMLRRRPTLRERWRGRTRR